MESFWSVCSSLCAEVRYLAAEVARLLQREDEGSHDFVGALLFVRTISYIGLEAFYELAIGKEADALIVAFQAQCLAFAGLTFVLELEEVAVATESEHSLDGVGEVEGAALACQEHCARLLICPIDGELDGIGIADLMNCPH